VTSSAKADIRLSDEPPQDEEPDFGALLDEFDELHRHTAPHIWKGEEKALAEYERTSELDYEFDDEVDLHGFSGIDDALWHLEVALIQMKRDGKTTIRVITGKGGHSNHRPVQTLRSAAITRLRALQSTGLVRELDDSGQYRGTTGALVVFLPSPLTSSQS
jgi:DNA-nicking Smr family endonuclease